MVEIKYTFSFTGASALISETLVIAQAFERLNDWKEVEQTIINQNLMNKIKHTTFKREFSEIKKRLTLLTPTQLSILANGSLDDAKMMILLSLLKTYSFIKDFIIEVIRNKYLMFDTNLMDSDYIRFVNAKKLIHEELERITEITAQKVKQVVFKMLEQIGLITHIKNGIIIKPYLSNQILDAIIRDDVSLLSGFLLSDTEIKAIKKI